MPDAAKETKDKTPNLEVVGHEQGGSKLKETIPPHTASIHAGPSKTLPTDFVSLALKLQDSLGLPLLLLLQNGGTDYDTIDYEVVEAFLSQPDALPKTPVALLIDSPGGVAKWAYQLAMILRRHCGGFTAVVPRYAKSAATLLTLGADKIVLGRDAELGPLDAQLIDPEREEPLSALDEVQALERLHAFAMSAVDESMLLLMGRTRKKIETLLPAVMHFVAEEMRPLFEKIDAVHYTQMSRIAKEAEEYAIRLLKAKHSQTIAEDIARRLVNKYPNHGYWIDPEEAAQVGFQIEKTADDRMELLDAMRCRVGSISAIGSLREMKK